MKRTTSFLVAELIVLSFSSAEACAPPETYTDQNGDKRHVRTDKVNRGYTSTRDSKKNNTSKYERKIYDTDRNKPLQDIGAVKLTNM